MKKDWFEIGTKGFITIVALLSLILSGVIIYKVLTGQMTEINNENIWFWLFLIK